MRAPACPLRPGPVASAGPTGYSAAMCAKIARQRADQLVFMQGLAESREQARRLIMAGKVALSSEGLPPGAPPQKVDKPGHPYPEGTVFELLGQERFVSRGAYKLLTILDNFKLDVSGMVCLDAGASTGGFTDCLLQHGATRVYAVDVGKNQLHEKLRADERVINLEGVNLRAAAPELIPEPVDLVVADVSFISLTLILPPCMTWLKPGGLAAVLIKPQFELGPGETVKGVVRDEAARGQDRPLLHREPAPGEPGRAARRHQGPQGQPGIYGPLRPALTGAVRGCFFEGRGNPSASARGVPPPLKLPSSSPARFIRKWEKQGPSCGIRKTRPVRMLKSPASVGGRAFCVHRAGGTSIGG